MRSIASGRPRATIVEVDAEEDGEDEALEANGKAAKPNGPAKKLKRVRERSDDDMEVVQAEQIQRPVPVRRQDKFRFCDVCGHGSTEVNCSTCPSSFHKRCLNRPPNYPFPKRWTCHSCVHRDLQKHGRIPE
eukprot:2338933-Rhodomonas_salina.1